MFALYGFSLLLRRAGFEDVVFAFNAAVVIAAAAVGAAAVFPLKAHVRREGAQRPSEVALLKPAQLAGHGVGRAMHEPPNVPNYGRPGKGMKLEPGLVIAIEPMITFGDYRVHTIADGWGVVTNDGSNAAHFEKTIAVTEDGPVVITNE